MFKTDFFTAGKVSDSTGYFKYFMIRPGTEIKTVKGFFKKLFGVLFKYAVFFHKRRSKP